MVHADGGASSSPLLSSSSGSNSRNSPRNGPFGVAAAAAEVVTADGAGAAASSPSVTVRRITLPSSPVSGGGKTTSGAIAAKRGLVAKSPSVTPPRDADDYGDAGDALVNKDAKSPNKSSHSPSSSSSFARTGIQQPKLEVDDEDGWQVLFGTCPKCQLNLELDMLQMHVIECLDNDP